VSQLPSSAEEIAVDIAAALDARYANAFAIALTETACLAIVEVDTATAWIVTVEPGKIGPAIP
jgi:hypothetical protein